MYEYVVVGNGMLGAALALALSAATPRVMVVGAGYGQRGLYSSHEDCSRLVRGYHQDVYWERLALDNRPLLDALADQTGLTPFRPVPVHYRQPRRDSDCLVAPGRPAADRGFSHSDRFGGVVDPGCYIAAMNRQARQQGAVITAGVVERVDRAAGGFRLTTSAGEITGRRVVDARGLYGAADTRGVLPRAGGVEIVGKVFVEAVLTDPRASEAFCFLDFVGQEPHFREVYGFVGEAAGYGPGRAKFGFAETQPVRLESAAEVQAWFSGGFSRYPYRQEAVDWLLRFDPRLRITGLRPCAFSGTDDGRPRFGWREGVLSITGCNGAAAKCCQALAQAILREAGWEG